MCVMLLLYLKRQYATVGRTLHILPCGTVSTFYIANQHSKTSTYTEDKNYYHYAQMLASLYNEYNYADNPFLVNQNITWEHI